MLIGDNQLEVVRSTNLLGVVISSDLKWNEHTKYTVTKARKRLWFIRRLSKLGASTAELLNLFHLMSRSILEMGARIFSGGLTQTNKQDFEDVHKGAFKICLLYTSPSPRDS